MWELLAFFLGDRGQPLLLLWEIGFGDNGGDFHNRVQEEEEEDSAVLSGGSNDGAFH